MPNPCIPCATCGFTMKPVWYLEKELDASFDDPYK